jgi:hypothetical protein
MRKIKYFTKDTLILANKVAIATNRNRSLYEDKLEDLPQDFKFPLGFTMIHNDSEMRVEITVAESISGPYGQVWLDIPFETYNALPEVEIDE